MAQTASVLLGIGAIGAILFWYLVHVDRAMREIPEESRKLSPPSERWTKDQVLHAYEKIKKTPIDFTPHLPPKQNRRYIVIGGSGLVGEHEHV
jgi:hypothetical protein